METVAYLPGQAKELVSAMGGNSDGEIVRGVAHGTQDDVLMASDGTLFLAGGRHEVIKLFSGEKQPSEASRCNLAENIEHRQTYCERHGIHFEAFVFPDKMPALGNLLPFSPVSLFENGYALAPNLKCHYLGSELASCEAPFPKTDTHYSVEGNHACARRIASPLFGERLDQFDAIVSRNTVRKNNFCGDLGRKFDPPIIESATALRRFPGFSMESNGMQSGNDGLMMIASNADAISDKRVLLFADSYFRALIPYLAFFFSHVVFCRTRFFHYELVQAIAPDAIFTGMAERYLSSCESDDRRPHFLSYPLSKGRVLQPSDGFGAAFDATVRNGKLTEHATWRS
ncbi:hypothetical protein [Marilutibacter alkalisoli]|uniref:Uncharacterized protein n=1 Tax=Marilutibacter alkalisoli TaxID=2591633 RepID=A0A514BUJ5_9GAMM|nr:hypothetical protein [Lysobacter alkalisoli]QDH71032.1 hypothetical protein FKV23_13765 [Lysobacter alkalisoli]